jgi:hypothetical protein
VIRTCWEHVENTFGYTICAKLLVRQVAFCPTMFGAKPRTLSQPSLKAVSDELPAPP